jgi:hypothetical protein
LIPSRSRAAAIRTCALYIAVGKKTTAIVAIGERHRVFIDIALIEQLEEKILGNVGMILSPSGGKQVKRNP